MKIFVRATALVGAAAWLLTGCAHVPELAEPAAPAVETGPPVSLAINGFNYTDLPISYFSVNGQGGSNIVVSSSTSGGGGTVCCASWRPGSRLPRPVTVEWLRVVNGRDRWCEKTVQLNGPVPDRPTALGVHFMPDGDIQVEMTRGEADPKLKLERFSAGKRKESGNVIYDEQVARCRDVR